VPSVSEAAPIYHADLESMDAILTDEWEPPQPPPNRVEPPADTRSPEEIHAMLGQQMTALQEDLLGPGPQQSAPPLSVQEPPRPPDEADEELAPVRPGDDASLPSVSEAAPEHRTEPESPDEAGTDEWEPPEPPPNRVEPPADKRSPEEIHAMLCQRMTALQEERQSRWRRILGILTGASGEK
jgi:hypothetical protein